MMSYSGARVLQLQHAEFGSNRGRADSNYLRSLQAKSVSPVSAELAGCSKGAGVDVQRPAVSCCSKLHAVGCF
ncbi:hypothetical protein XENOCAPTIV_024901 [Xenoophorus captivus]|uniref:Uncharacterized protein n=1 Tax=Xenoophorus captivus TaxID=1517983 RepID=A0ABV0S926_9TELE